MLKMAFVILSLAAAAPAYAPISPGLWEVSNRMEEATFNNRRSNVPMPPSMPQLICLAETDAARGPGLAFLDADNCRVLKAETKEGAFEFETECKATESSDVILTKATGNFAATSYSGMSTSIQYREGIKIEMRSRMSARLVGQCQDGTSSQRDLRP